MAESEPDNESEKGGCGCKRACLPGVGCLAFLLGASCGGIFLAASLALGEPAQEEAVDQLLVDVGNECVDIIDASTCQ